MQVSRSTFFRNGREDRLVEAGLKYLPIVLAGNENTETYKMGQTTYKFINGLITYKFITSTNRGYNPMKPIDFRPLIGVPFRPCNKIVFRGHIVDTIVGPMLKGFSSPESAEYSSM